MIGKIAYKIGRGKGLLNQAIAGAGSSSSAASVSRGSSSLLDRAIFGGQDMVGGMHSMVERGMGALGRMKTGIENMPGRFSAGVRSGLNNIKSQYKAGMDTTDPTRTGLMLHPTHNNAARGARGELDHMSQTELSKLVGGPEIAPTPGPTVASNAAVTPDGGGLAGASNLAMIAGMAGIGGATSYATGGNFGQGAMLGAAGGYGMMAGARVASRHGVRKFAKGTMAGDASRSVRGFLKPKVVDGDMASAVSKGTTNQRGAMLAGSALSGMVFGGNRRSHKRGFNSRRGNGF